MKKADLPHAPRETPGLDTQWQTALTAANAAPRCGAKTRASTSCRGPAMANGRCRMHGGQSTGPKTARGRLASQTARWRHGRYAAQRPNRLWAQGKVLGDIIERHRQAVESAYMAGTAPQKHAHRSPERFIVMTPPNTLPAAFPANARIRTWFSFRSPYSYLGVHKALKAGLPLDLVATWPDGDVGSTSSPRKMAYLIEDCLRLFEEEGLPFAPPVDMEDWARPHGAFRAAQKAGKGRDFVLAAYRARWSESRDLADSAVIGALAEQVEIDPQSAIDAMDDPAIREELLAIRTQFAQDEIVGVPFFVYEGQRFWGQDRVGALMRHINKVHSGIS